MSRLKKSSTVLETAQQRLAGYKSVRPAPDFGPGLTLANYEAEIQSFSTRLNSYNESLSSLDQSQNELETDEAELRELNRRMLAAAEAHYGPDSSEYEQVGGTRISDRKRPAARGETPGTPPAQAAKEETPVTPSA